MRKDKKSILNFSVSIFYKVATILIGILLPKLFITTYGSAINGLQSSVTQIFTYIALLESGIGVSTIQSLYKPIANKDYKTANSYLSATTQYYNKIGVIYFLILFIVAIVYPFVVTIDGTSYITVFLYIILSGALTGISFFYLAKIKLLISAEGDGYIVSAVSMLIYICSSICKIALILVGVNIVVVQAAFLTINLVFTFVYYIIAKRKYPWVSFREKPDFSCVAQKNSVMVHKISGLIFQNVDIILLTFLCDLKIVSIYTLYKMVVNMVTTVITTIGDSINFVLGQTFNTEKNIEKPKYCSIIDTYNVFYSAISFALFGVLFVLLLPFMRLYTNGMDINYILPALPYLFLIIEFLTVGRDAMLRTIEVAGHFKKTQSRAVIEAALNLTTSIVAILICKHYFGYVGGLYGALIGTIISMLYRTIDINIYANKKVLSRSSKKTFKVMLTNFVLFVSVILFNSFQKMTIDNYMQFFIVAAVLSLGFLTTFIIFQGIISPSETRFIFNYIKEKIKSRK